MGDDDSGSSCSCNCGGCLTALVVGTAIVGSIALGGVGNAWDKVQSIWDYDNQTEAAHKIADEDGDGVLSPEERFGLYKKMGIPTIEGEVPKVKVPYSTLAELTQKYGQQF